MKVILKRPVLVNKMKKQCNKIFILIFILALVLSVVSACVKPEKKQPNHHLEHTFGEWVMQDEPSLSVDGVKIKKCSGCSEEQRETIPKLPQRPFIKFTLNQQRTHYMVTGLNLATQKNVVIPSEFNTLKVKEISSGAFNSNHFIKTVLIEDEITTISGGAFKSCTSLESVKLPSTLEMIGANSFNGCTKLVEINFPLYLKQIKQGAFQNCTALQNVQFNEGLEIIGNAAFQGASALTKVSLPTSLLSLGSSAFYLCKNLKEVEFSSGLSRIAENTFHSCYSLNNLVFPKEIKSIASHAFASCYELNDVTFFNAAIQIDANAFINAAYVPSKNHEKNLLKAPKANGYSFLTPMVGEVEEEMLFTWYSAFADGDIVQLSLDETFSSIFKSEYAIEKGESEIEELYYFHARVALTPGTVYYYRVGNGATWSESYTVMSQDTTHGYEFLIAGDPQIGSSGNEYNDGKTWANTIDEAMEVYPQSAFMLTLGDQVDHGNNTGHYNSFKSAAKLRSLPLATLVGNHEALYQSPMYSQHFVTPNHSNHGITNVLGKNSCDYYFGYGDALFIVLNTNTATGVNNIKPDVVGHKVFINEVLNAVGANYKWKIVAFHQAIFSSGKHVNDVDTSYLRNELAPFFTEKGIHLVLNGHDHVYTRTFMMNGLAPIETPKAESVFEDFDVGNVTYLTLNSAAEKFDKLYGKFRYAAVQLETTDAHITGVRITPSSIKVTTHNAENNMEITDEFSLILDDEAPIFTFPSSAVQVGDVFDPMHGVKAFDYVDGDVLSRVLIDGTVDIQKVGSYILTYSVSDKKGNSVTQERVVHVIEKATPPKKEGCGASVNLLFLATIVSILFLIKIK